MKTTQSALAARIRNAKPMDSEGRYDMASKAEVRAFLAEEVEEQVYALFKAISVEYEARIAELELSIWARIKRFFRSTGKGPTEVV